MPYLGHSRLNYKATPKRSLAASARNMGNKTPMRLIASAKSWLCHGGVDRRSAFLPQGSDDEVQKVSPLKAH